MILSVNNYIVKLARTALLTLALPFALVACLDDAGSAAPPDSVIRVVATTSVVADWVENIGGEHVEVFSVVPAGSDPHGFQPGARDVTKIADADLVLSIGLGLEGSWLRELVENAARDPSSIVELGEAIDPIEFAESHADEVELLEELNHIVHEVEGGEITPEAGLEEVRELLAAAEGDEEEQAAMALGILDTFEAGQIEADDAIEALEDLAAGGEEEHEGHGHGLEDPHFWFDPLRVKIAVDDIAARLSGLDPDRGGVYVANASAYNERLDELHSWTEEQVSVVPEERRLLLTSHDSLGYFANLYGFEVIGVILGVSTEREPSAADLADLVEEVEEEGISAVFGETTVSERLAIAIAEESGVKLVRLYSGALGDENSVAATYLEMVRTNVERIVEALR